MPASGSTISPSGIRVLVTRPREQAKALVLQLKEAGFETVEMPCIEIAPLDPTHVQFDYDDYDVVVFTSVHAVAALQSVQPFPWHGGKTAVLAVGPATAKSLKDCGQNVTEEPVHPFNSEALLKTATLNSRKLLRVAIIKGVGGREVLEKNLQQRSFNVNNIITYKRLLPETSRAQLEAAFLNSPVDIVTITSNEMLHNLIRLAGDRFRAQLIRLPLAVNSPRAAAEAKNFGFQNAIMVARASLQSARAAKEPALTPRLAVAAARPRHVKLRLPVLPRRRRHRRRALPAPRQPALAEAIPRLPPPGNTTVAGKRSLVVVAGCRQWHSFSDSLVRCFLHFCGAS